jgi:formamidopyrimidine-DNA glycosylase
MPELPEVETIRRDLLSQVVGRGFDDVELGDTTVVHEPSPLLFCDRLRNQGIKDVRRRGKYLVFPLSSGENLIFHLKMSGFLQFKLPPEDSGLVPRAVFRLDNGKELHFYDRRKLGMMWLVDDEDDIVGKLGPEPLDPQFTPELLGKLLGRSNVSIKALLCDQHVIAGIGNMYADEALFAARIHPMTKGKDLSMGELKRLHTAIREVLASAIVNGGASVDTYQRPTGELGFAQFFFRVAHRRGEFCYDCSAPIERRVIRGRASYFCPVCQAINL